MTVKLLQAALVLAVVALFVWLLFAPVGSEAAIDCLNGSEYVDC